MTHIQPLRDGPIDIIGDVHGEKAALEDLLVQLGYAPDGTHKQERRLVFLGDLVDRGPDSPGVLDIVMALCASGAAQCIMGNHELAIVRGRPGHGNQWILPAKTGHATATDPVKQAAPARREAYLDFMASRPIALENEALRVVHACWHPKAIARLKEDEYAELPIAKLYDTFDAEIMQGPDMAQILEGLARESGDFDPVSSGPEWQARDMPVHTKREILLQMNNPLRVLTTSAVRPAAAPYFFAEHWRMTERTTWWDDYHDNPSVIIGHFWRRFDPAAKRIYGIFGRDVFENIPPHAWMGAGANVYCIDYSVGQLHVERRENPGAAPQGKLTALRYPEWEIHHHDGTMIPIGPPGK